MLPKNSLFALLLLLTLAGCSFPMGRATTFDRRAMLQDMTHNAILPLHEQFAAEAAHLQEAAHAFQAAPSAEALETLQGQWRSTVEAWNRVELLEIGPVRDARLHNEIEKWPPNEEFIEEFIAGEALLDEAFVAGSGSTSKGLPAIEYLLFDAEGDNARSLASLTEGAAGRRVAYLVALTDHLRGRADALLALWAESGDNYALGFIEADSDGGELQGSVSMMANEMIVLIEGISQMKLADPLGLKVYGVVQPDHVEAHRSDQGTASLIANLEGFRQTFTGDAGQGFDDYLDFLGAQHEAGPLSAAILAQTDATLEALRAIDGPIEEALTSHPEQVRHAYDEVQALLVLVKVDMTSQLGVTVTFNDNDGD